jgi:hypothetical protein
MHSTTVEQLQSRVNSARSAKVTIHFAYRSNLLFTGSGCAAWWISEGAAIGLLRLVSSAAADSGAKSCLARGHVVKASAPATQNDQRFVQALCMLALQRSLAALGPDRELTKVLSGAFSRWAAVYSDASGGEAPVPTEWYRMA